MTMMAPLLKTMSPSSSLRTSSCQITIHSRLCWSMPTPRCTAHAQNRIVLYFPMFVQCLSPLAALIVNVQNTLQLNTQYWRFNPANPQRPTVTKNNNNAPFRSLPLTLLSCIQDVPEWWWALNDIDQLHCPGSDPSGFIDNVFLQIGLVQESLNYILDNRLTFFFTILATFRRKRPCSRLPC